MPSEIVTWVQMLIKLGLAVWQAVEAGDNTKTVGEIFAGVPRDADAMKAVRDEHAKWYAEIDAKHRARIAGGE